MKAVPWLAAASASMALMPLHAAEVRFAGAQVASQQTVQYRCQGGQSLRVRYINTRDGDALAYLPVQGQRHIFVAAVAGSGVRYVSGLNVWWTKGNSGTLWNSPDPAAKPLLADCQARPQAR